jgi:hypothetical protein
LHKSATFHWKKFGNLNDGLLVEIADRKKFSCVPQNGERDVMGEKVLFSVIFPDL